MAYFEHRGLFLRFLSFFSREVKTISHHRRRQTIFPMTKTTTMTEMNVLNEENDDQNPSVKTLYEPTETFQFTHFASCDPPGVKCGFIKGEAIRLLRTNSSRKKFEEGLLKFKQHLKARGYPENIIERSLSGVNFVSGQSALIHTQKPKGHGRLLICHNVPLGRLKI